MQVTFSSWKYNKKSTLFFRVGHLKMPRDDICHKHHKQRLCKIITTRLKFYFVDVF